MASRRQRKVAELIHEEISVLIQRETQDPRLGFVTVTGVDVSPDLKSAQVHITTLDDSDIKSTLEGLSSAASYYRHRLAQTLSLRYVPTGRMHSRYSGPIIDWPSLNVRAKAARIIMPL
ncbi:MAG: 30S ribosome-binding factor RbfA, partial [Chloroflexota bacterium]